jgi:hypothetical protein
MSNKPIHREFNIVSFSADKLRCFIILSTSPFINNKLEKTWKEVVVARLKIIIQHLTGGVDKKNHRKPQSGEPVSEPTFIVRRL